MDDWDGLNICEACGDAYTTGRLCTSCAHQEMIDNAEGWIGGDVEAVAPPSREPEALPALRTRRAQENALRKRFDEAPNVAERSKAVQHLNAMARSHYDNGKDIDMLLAHIAALEADRDRALDDRATALAALEGAENTLAEVSNYCIDRLQYIDERRGSYTPPEYGDVEDIIGILNPPTPAQEAQMQAEMDEWMAYMRGFKVEDGKPFVGFRAWPEQQQALASVRDHAAGGTADADVVSDRELNWVAENFAEIRSAFGGKWIAVKGDAVVAFANDAKSLRNSLNVLKVRSAFVKRIPLPDEEDQSFIFVAQPPPSA